MKRLPVLFCLVALFLSNLGQTIFAGDAPGFTQHPKEVMVPVGETLRLSCLVTGTPPISFIWKKDTAFLGDQTNAMLIFTNALRKGVSQQ